MGEKGSLSRKVKWQLPAVSAKAGSHARLARSAGGEQAALKLHRSSLGKSTACTFS